MFYSDSRHRLHGAFLKVVRAQDHLNDLRLKLLALQDGECQIVPEKDEDSGRGVLRINIVPKPTGEFSVIVGECLYQIRSPLDHIIYALVETNGQKPTDRTMFPICTKPDKFAGQVKSGRLNGVPAKALAIIESLQPYDGRDNPLRIMADLHNTDKHRTLNLTTAVAEDAVIEWNSHSPLIMMLGNTELRDGAVFGNLAFPAEMLARLTKMEVKGKATIFVAFDDPAADELAGLQVDRTLENILEFVRNDVFPAFDEFFDQ